MARHRHIRVKGDEVVHIHRGNDGGGGGGSGGDGDGWWMLLKILGCLVVVYVLTSLIITVFNWILGIITAILSVVIPIVAVLLGVLLVAWIRDTK